jgi:hypothetical protein
MAAVTVRFRLNVRLPDGERKWRDEITQEAEIQLDEVAEGVQSSLEELSIRALNKAEELRRGFYAEAKRLGAADYTEEVEV